MRCVCGGRAVGGGGGGCFVPSAQCTVLGACMVHGAWCVAHCALRIAHGAWRTQRSAPRIFRLGWSHPRQTNLERLACDQVQRELDRLKEQKLKLKQAVQHEVKQAELNQKSQ